MRWVALLPNSPSLLPKGSPMSKLISALKRTVVGAPDGEAPVHFHQGMTDAFPEVCHDGRCDRPQLNV